MKTRRVTDAEATVDDKHIVGRAHNEAVRATNLMAREILRGHDVVMDAAIARLRAKATELEHGRARRQQPSSVAMPPPVAGRLHGFARMIAEKVDAVAALLKPEQRERLRVIAPGFVRALFANDPDVVHLVSTLLAATPEGAAFCIIGYLDILERRFAS